MPTQWPLVGPQKIRLCIWVLCSCHTRVTTSISGILCRRPGLPYTKQMPFGLTGAPTTIAHVTAEKLGDLLPKLDIELLVDDGGMAGDDFENLLDHTKQFLTCVRETHLLLSAKKSEFFMTEIIFAGSQVGPNGVKPDTTKLTAVVEWCQPPDLLNLSHFLGLTGYFCDLVKGYSRIAQPLTNLIQGAAVPKDAGKAAYRAALQAIKLPNVW